LLCEVATPSSGPGRCSDFADDRLENLPREGIDGDLGGLPYTYVDDVSLVHAHFGGNHRHVGHRHERASGEFWMPDDDSLAFADGEVGNDAVERARA